MATLDARTEDFGQRLQRFSSLLEESLDTATSRAREIAGMYLANKFQNIKGSADTLLELAGIDMEELAPVEVFLPRNPSENVPVTLESLVTETGVLGLWFVARDGRRWKLEFNVRPKGPRR